MKKRQHETHIYEGKQNAQISSTIACPVFFFSEYIDVFLSGNIALDSVRIHRKRCLAAAALVHGV